MSAVITIDKLSEWVHKDAAAYAVAVTSVLGMPQIWNVAGGVAVWQPRSYSGPPTDSGFVGSGLPNCFTKHMVRDESIPHACPAAHSDFFYSYLPLILSPASLAKISKLSESIGYDKQQNILSIRCGSLEQCIIMARIVLELLSGKTSLQQLLRSTSGGRVYVKTVARASDPAFVTNSYQMLYADLLDHYQSAYNHGYSLNNGFWEGACGPEQDGPQGVLGWLFGPSKKPIPKRPGNPDMLATLTKMKAAKANLAELTRPIKRKTEHFDDSDSGYTALWYTSNDPGVHRIGWDDDERPYKIYAARSSAPPQIPVGPSRSAVTSNGSPGTPIISKPTTEPRARLRPSGTLGRKKSEYMVEASPAEDRDPWYTTEFPGEFDYGAYDSQTYLPPHRDALLAQSEYTMSGLREGMEAFRVVGRPTNCACRITRYGDVVCRCGKGCICHRRHRAWRAWRARRARQEQLDGSGPTFVMSPSPVLRTGDKDATKFNDSYRTTDPRFLVGTATLHFNVDSDTQDITRVYGTVAQKKHYPRLADFFNYDIASTIDQ